MGDTLRYRLEVLNEHHSVKNFTCGDDDDEEYHDINEYLRDVALLDMSRGVARTFVEIDEEKPVTNNVAGFFTFRADALSIAEDYFADPIEGEDDTTHYAGTIDVPLIELMYLARDLQWKGIGMGDVLMIDALRIVARAADCIGFIGLHLRFTGRGKKLYEAHGFQPFRSHPNFDTSRYLLSVDIIREIVKELDPDIEP